MAPLRALMLAAATSAIMTIAATAAYAVVEERVGDRVFLVRDKAGTPTQFQMIVLAGCGEEAYGQCRGIAHYLEHLVLVGRNPERPDSAIRFFPDAQSNGWTNLRATAYIHTVPARPEGPKADLQKLFAFYAARLKDFTISDEDAVRERNVVLQEHDWRVGGNPFNRFRRRLDRELLPDHPSGQWTIGMREDIERFTVAEAKAFHESWYVINNVYFVIKADIDAKDLKELADRELGGLKTKQLPARSIQRQPEIPITRADLRHSDAQVKRTSVIYKKLVRVVEDDPAIGRAARAVLMNFLTSRLPGSAYDVLTEKKQVAATGPAISLTRAAPKSLVLTVSADVAPDASADALLAAIGEFVDGLDKTALSPEMVARLKKRLADSRANDDQDADRVYRRLVFWLADRSSYADYVAWPARLGQVSPTDIQSILSALAGPGKVVTGTIMPAQEAGK